MTPATRFPTPSLTWSIVPIEGDIDVAAAPALRARLAGLTDDAPAFVILDLGGLTFIDSTGLGVLVGALRRSRAGGGDLRLAAPGTGILRVLRVTGLDRAFQTFDTVEEAQLS